MFEHRKPDVLVVGAGPVGQFAALLLARRGLHPRVVDHEWRTGAHSFALALHARSLQLLQEAEILDDVLPHAHRIHTIGLFEGSVRRGEIRLDGMNGDFPFIAVLRQDVLEDRLEEALHDVGVKVEWNHHVASLFEEEGHVEVTIDRLEQASFGYAVAHPEWIVGRSRKLEVPYVIGADGHLSLVRSALNLDFRDAAPPQYFAVFEFRTNVDLGGEVRVDFGPDSTNVLWPLPNGYCRWSFQLRPSDAEVGLREKDRNEVDPGATEEFVLTDEHLQAFILSRAPWFKGSVEEMEWRMVVRFDRRLVDRFGRGRMWLAGDAAHMTGPVGIQSMNVGLYEAHALTEAIADIIQDGVPTERLEAYSRRQVEAWRFLLGLQGGLEPDREDAAWIAPYADRLVSCLPAFGEDLDALVRQLGLRVTPPISAGVGV